MLRKYLPFLTWLPGYGRAQLQGDAVAGLTVAVMLIPQGMGYAMLAGLPPIVGLYASLVPVAVYGLLGTSRQLAVGPVAMVSLLVAAGVGSIAAPGSDTYIAHAVLLALMVGVMQLFMGLARLGFLVSFLSHPVISGFTSAAALIIGFSQLGHLLGVRLPRSHLVHEILHQAATRIDEVHLITLGIGVASIAALLLAKRYRPMFPAGLAVVLLSSLAVWLLGLDARGVAIVGEVPAGLPAPRLPGIELAAVEALLPVAVTIALVGFMESISVAKSFARRNRYDIDASQELVGLGMANTVGALFGAYPVTGGFSRTAVNAQAGARTGMASLITAAVIALTLLFLTPLFYYLPSVVLAAIIMTAVVGLVDIAEVRHLWRVKRIDLVFWAVTFAATLALGIEEGILVGVSVSLLVFVARTTRPHVAVLGRLPGTDVYRNVARFPEAVTTPGVLVVRMDAQLYFGNIDFLKATLRKLEQASDAPLRAVVLDASGINQIDSSAASALEDLHASYQRRGVALYLAGVKGPVRDVIERAHLREAVGPERFTLRVHDAVERAARDPGAGEAIARRAAPPAM